jgi:hypothetical protein
MARWVSRAAWLLALAATLLTLPPTETDAQRFVSPTTRYRNQKKANDLIQQANVHLEKFNRLWQGKSTWEIEPEKAASEVAETALVLNDLFKVLNHFDEDE